MRLLRNNWIRLTAYGVVIVLCATGILWLPIVWLIERPTPFAGTDVPRCGGAVNAAYRTVVEKARRQVQALMFERNIPGLTIAAAVDAQIVWTEGFGYANQEEKIKACPDAQFRIASMSKLLTAAAMGIALERGRLDLDAPVQQYVPSFPDKEHRITARQLASHKAGIRGYRDDFEAINTDHYTNVVDSLEKFKADPLEFTPGTRFQYSSYGYVLLSAAIQGAIRQDFLSIMRDNVLLPLRMTNTVAEHSDQPTRNVVCFYDNETPFSTDGSMVKSPFNDFSCKWASGGFLSTAEDLARFGSAHLGNQFLKPETLRLLFTPQSGLPPFAGYGFGWMSARDLHLRKVHFHFGAASGGTSLLVIYPEQKVCVAVLSNLGHAKLPFKRLMGIVNPFVSDRNLIVLAACSGLLLSGVLLRLLLRRGQ